jgi:hypothetical protein
MCVCPATASHDVYQCTQIVLLCISSYLLCVWVCVCVLYLDCVTVLTTNCIRISFTNCDTHQHVPCVWHRLNTSWRLHARPIAVSHSYPTARSNRHMLSTVRAVPAPPRFISSVSSPHHCSKVPSVATISLNPEAAVAQPAVRVVDVAAQHTTTSLLPLPCRTQSAA